MVSHLTYSGMPLGSPLITPICDCQLAAIMMNVGRQVSIARTDTTKRQKIPTSSTIPR